MNRLILAIRNFLFDLRCYKASGKTCRKLNDGYFCGWCIQILTEEGPQLTGNGDCSKCNIGNIADTMTCVEATPGRSSIPHCNDDETKYCEKCWNEHIEEVSE